MRIRAQLILMAAAVLLPVVIAAGTAIEKVRNGEREAALRGLNETVRATALIVDREIQGSLSALKVLGNSKNLDSQDLKAFYQQAKELDNPPYVWTLLLDNTGKQLANTIVPFGTPAPPPVAKDRVNQVLSTQAPLVSDLVLGPVTGKLLTTVYSPALAAGGEKYVVAQGFAVEHWMMTAMQAKLPPDWIVAVIDRKGKFIARSHKTEQFLGQQARPELVAAAAASAEGMIRHSTLEGVDSYDAFTHSSLTGWTIAVAAPVKSIEAAAGRAVEYAIMGMAIAVGLGLLIAGALGQRFIKAIESAGAAAIALGRGESPVINPTAIQEVDELNKALLDAGALLNVERRSREAAEAERERLLATETELRETAQAENVAKDNFLAMLGHELRNPLAAIAGATSLLERTGEDKARSAMCLDILRRQNGHLSHIVDDLLDISRLIAGKIELVCCPVDLADCVMRCAEALRTTARASNFRIVVEANPVWVNGDAVRLDQILNNLITNALKYSPIGSEVLVTVWEESGRAMVQVRDHGTGMSAELLSRMFEPFIQGPPPENRTQSGLGIGLALVRQLVQLHGGEVEAHSPGIDKGSTLRFWLPSIPPQRHEVNTEPSSATIARKVVYIEDNDDARATAADLLRMSGYDVVEVANGTNALPAVLKECPDVVIMDIGLPDIDGYEVANRLRANVATSSIPLIALTGYSQLRNQDIASGANFSAHLVKPVSPDQIIEAIEKVLASVAERGAGG